MKKIFLYCLIIFLSLTAAYADSSAEESSFSNKKSDILPIGIYIVSIHDINFTDESYTITFWAWWKSKRKTYDPATFLEVINAKEFTCQTSYTRKSKNGYYMAAKYTAKINQKWLTKNYPFDRQDLEIILESVGRNSMEVSFTPDMSDSVINQDISLKLWEIGDLCLSTVNYSYPTGFGEEQLKQEVYPRLLVNIPIQRIGYRIFIASFIGFIISFFITILLYFINMEDISSRLSLSLASLFATVGNKYTIDTTLPMGSTFSLADIVALSTFAIVVISIFVTIICPWLIKHDKRKAASTVNWIAFSISCPMYILLILFRVLSANI
jgi:hypothetical protein